MEGAGSRQSRASSRYASSPSAPPFNGPVRKWKKQWVTSQSSGLNSGNNRNNAPPLLLCRWTPLSATATASADEPPRRRFRYAPMVPIAKGNMRTLDKDNNETITNLRNQTSNGSDMRSESGGMLEKPSNGEFSGEEAQENNEDQADSIKALFHSSYS